MSEGLTCWDVEQLERMVHGNKNAGMIVETTSDFTGRTYNNRELVNGKVQVFLTDGRKMLCDPAKLKLKGFID